MNNDIVVSKIVGSPNESSWSQASSTGKLYIAISLSLSDGKKGAAALGKELLEQIQREFFALDEKKLSDIKSVIEKIFSPLETNTSYSAVIGSIQDNILYIVTASKGNVLIDRNGSLAEVARGEEGEIIGFSGRIKNDDIIILETNEFNRKISNKLLAEYTNLHDSEKIAEDLAPFILEDSRGEEAAVIIHYKNAKKESAFIVEDAEPAVTSAHPEERDEYATESTPKEIGSSESRGPRTSFINSLKAKIPPFSKKQKRIFILVGIIVLLLIGSLFAERHMEARRVAEKEFNSVYASSTEKLESAKGLSSINRGRALEEVNEAIQNIESNLDKFREGSSEYKQLTDLLAQLKALRDELGGGSEIAGSVIFEPSDSDNLENISQISASNERLVVIGDNGYAVINENGDIASEEEVETSNIKRAISDDTYLYLLGSNVNRITISSGNNTEIIEDSSRAVDISYFGSNIYLLNSGGEVVTRYSGSAYQEANYFSDDISLSGTPVTFAIDSSIYILTDNGSIEKFTRGEKDNGFTLDSSVKISRNAIAYSREDFDHIYILDIDNASIIQLDSEGSMTKQFNSLDLQNAKSFTVNGNESKVFAVIGDEVYSYDL